MRVDKHLKKDIGLGSLALWDLMGRSFYDCEVNSIVKLDETCMLIIGKEWLTIFIYLLLDIRLFEIKFL